MSGTAAAKPLEDYTIGEVLEEARRQDVSLVLSGTGSLLAMLGSAMLEALGEKPEGRASVTVEVTGVTEIRIRWGEADGTQ